MEKINIAELLKDCPSGMELDCTMYEDVRFDYVDELNIIHCYIQRETHKTALTFNQHGTPNSDIKSKCVIFPKGKTTWEEFQRPFKDGEIVACDNPYINSSEIFIFKDKKGCNILSNCYLMLAGDELNIEERAYYVTRHATEEEKAKLFQVIKDNGYKWNDETKTLEKLVESEEDTDDRIVMSGIYFDRENYADEVELRLGNYEIEIRDGKTYAVFKNQKTETLKPKFNDGDIIYIKSKSDLNLELVGIYKKEDNELIYDYCSVSLNSQSFYHHNVHGLISKNNIDISRLATECEKRKLFDAINENGYKWNDETKTLEKLVEPKFKVGDKIRYKADPKFVFTITSITKDKYECGKTFVLRFTNQDEYELVLNKFDITTLKPFDKVLYRMHDKDTWCNSFYSFYKNNHHFVTSLTIVKQCIPYEENKHLLGTTDDCDEFYKTWE